MNDKKYNTVRIIAATIVILIVLAIIHYNRKDA